MKAGLFLLLALRHLNLSLEIMINWTSEKIMSILGVIIIVIKLLDQAKEPKQNMFSLADEIEKFQKTILTLPDSIMTIDERFLGGGIKMQDLIQENSFIIQEMRKFKSIFLNYCKLNDKIYTKIIEHEVNSNEHFNKIMAISSSIDRKMQISDQELKKVKEDVLTQMFGLREFVEGGMKNTKQSVAGKVNQEGFVLRVKKIIEEYEQENATSSLPSDSQARINSDGTATPLPFAGGKKRRGLTMEDIQAFKSQITPLIDEVNQRVNAQVIQLDETKFSIKNQSLKITKLQQEQNFANQDILNIRKSIDEVKAYLNSEDQKLIQLLRQTINEGVWLQRFQYFKEKTVMPIVQGLSTKLYRSVQDVKKDVEENVKPKFIDLISQIGKLREKQKSLESKIIKSDQKHNQIIERINKTKNQVQADIKQQGRKIQRLLIEQSASQKSQQEKLENELRKINGTIDSMINTTQQMVLKKVQNKVGKQMKQIRGDISTLNRKTSQINSNVKFNGEQVGHVKDIVATKANYTDLIMYFDKKADKQEFKQLQGLFSDSPKGSNRNNCYTNDEIYKNESQRKMTEERRKRKSSYSKRMTTPIYTRNEDDPTRYLLCGLQSPQSKQIAKNTMKNSHHYVPAKIRNKSIRPSTANTLFLL